MKKTLLTLLLLGFSSLSAYECCPNFSLYVDYLYWQVCDPEAYTNEQVGNDIIFDTIDASYQSNWRIGGRYQRNCWDLSGRYTSVDNKNDVSSSTTDKLFYRLDFDIVDLELGYTINFGSDRLQLRPMLGTKLLWLKDQRELVFTLNRISANSENDAYGLYVGAEAAYRFDSLCWCPQWNFALIGRSSYGVLHSKFKGLTTFPGFPARIVQKTDCNYITAIEVFVGLDITYHCFECLEPHLIIGYEMNSISDIFKTISEFTTVELNVGSPIGLSGLVTRFQVDF